MSKLLHLDVLNHYVEYMDISATIFTEQLCDTDQYQSTSDVYEKCSRMTFEVICKCLMGDISYDSQTCDSDPIYDAIHELSEMTMWRVKHMLLLKLVNLFPIGNWLLMRMSKSMSSARKGSVFQH